ncbi:MAG: diguanylate cyclase [Desulfopila sp.]
MTLHEFLREKVSFPAPTAVTVKVLQTINSGGSQTELADIIATDPILTKRILTIVNGSAPSPAETAAPPIREVSAIDCQLLKNTALSWLIFASVQLDRQESFDIDLFWRQAITSAVAAEALTRQIGRPADDIFVAALLQDFGVLALVRSLGEACAEIFAARQISTRTAYDKERKRLGFSHAEVGYHILSRWQLPESICTPILTHHAPSFQRAIGPVEIINIADQIATIYQGRERKDTLLKVQRVLREHFGLSSAESAELIETTGGKAATLIEAFTISANDQRSLSRIALETSDELARQNRDYRQQLRELVRAGRRAERLVDELKKANDNLRNLALYDGLTGLYNHRYFQGVLFNELESAKRYAHPLSLMMIDIDFFKNINDRYGHPTGDYVLQQVSRTLTSLVRNCDIVARYGGEEFAIILPKTGEQGAKAIAQRLCRDIEKNHIRHENTVIPLTISIGVASTETSGADISQKALISDCDKALYAAKRNGRNTVKSAVKSKN